MISQDSSRGLFKYGTCEKEYTYRTDQGKGIMQIPLEEDINVSDSRPDVGKPVFTRGKIKVDEVKSGTNKVWGKRQTCVSDSVSCRRKRLRASRDGG